jgi:hypothetical protein
MDKKILIRVSFTVLIPFFLGAAISQASPILDQSHAYLSGDNYYTQYRASYDHMLAQTFTVGLDGLLSSVGIHNYKGSGTGVNLEFELRAGDEEGTTLASATYLRTNAPDVYHWKSFDVTSSGIWVNAGQTYAIVLGVDSSPGGWTWSGARYQASESGYAGGAGLEETSGGWTEIDPPDRLNQHIYYTHFDFNFRTYVDPNPIPVPGAFWLLGSGFIAIVGVKRRRVNK